MVPDPQLIYLFCSCGWAHILLPKSIVLGTFFRLVLNYLGFLSINIMKGDERYENSSAAAGYGLREDA